MKVVFIGGGSFQTLPVARGAMAQRRIFDGGEMNLYDLNAARAETMGRMLMTTPEYAKLDCKIKWGTPLEEALDGADAVSVVIPAGSPLVCSLSDQAHRRLGFMSSDQLSPSGAFRALTAGPFLLSVARKMEKLCPHAWLACFANPVAVYSGMINNHTKINALGICGGYTNHMWDLTRLMGKDEFCPDYDVEVAGVNHLSFIIRGKFRGEDLYEVLGRHLTKNWRPPRLRKQWKHMEEHIIFGLQKLVELYRNFGIIIFSTEGDGMAHLFYEEMLERGRKGYVPRTKAQIKADVKRWQQWRVQADANFRAMLDRDLDKRFWQTYPKKNLGFARNDQHITVKILKALAGAGKQKIVASRPNRGAVEGFKHRTVLEYSQTLDSHGAKPYGKLSIPDGYHGLISSIATHQTLLGDAIAAEDPKTLFQALFTYPIHHNTKASRALYKELLEIHKEEIPAAFQKAKEYF